jgi:hypothetical protein
MRKFVASLLFALIACASAFAQGQAGSSLHHDSGIFYAPTYNTWTAKVQGGPYAAGTVTVAVASSIVTLSDGYQFSPWSTSNPVNIGQGATLETLTPSAVSTGACPQGGGGQGVCELLTLATSFTHGQGDNVTSGSGGLNEAINDANANGGGVVAIDNLFQSNFSTTASANTTILASPIFANVSIQDNRGPVQGWWTVQPSALTALATPATRSATAGTTQVISGTATGTWTAVATYVCVTYVDIQGQESPCSATYNFTATASVALNFASPAASTGAVGWRAYAGVTSLATAYQLPITSANCTLTTLETVQPACAIGSAGVFPTPTTTTKLHPGYVVATYNPADLSHTTFGWQLSTKPPSTCTPESNFGPFLATAGGTTTQQQVVGSVELSTACLNQINKTIRVSGKINDVAGSGETPTIQVMLGPSFTTGTPTSICKMVGTTSTGAGVTTNDNFTCIITVNATGTSGTVMPNGTMIVSNTAGTVTASTISVDTATAAVTTGLTLQNTLYIVYTPTSATNTSAQLLDLHVEDL